MSDKHCHRFLFAEPQNEVIFDGFKTDAAKKRIDIIPVYREKHTRVGIFLQKVIMSARINQHLRMPFRKSFISIDDYHYRDDIDYYMIVPSMSIIRWEIDEIIDFKGKHPNIEMILLIVDSLHSGSRHLPFVRDKIFSDIWDLTITYDKFDAEEYGFLWLGYTYYPQCDILPDIKETSDALYIGFNKGSRNILIGEIFEYLKKADVDCDFRVIAVGNEREEIVPGLCITQERYRYAEIAAMVNNTNCIIEVLMEGQGTQSYRYFEAITYNKKLLTNNRNVSTLPYYDERYMKYFETTQDIDVDWVKKKELIDYGYQGEFAQIFLLDFLEKQFELDII